MDIDKYLSDVLESQTLADDGEEMKALRKRRDEVEKLLRESFKDTNPTIRYAGSFSKKTMIKEYYDLDIACYFPRNDDDAGSALKDIYCNVRDALKKKYVIEPKNSALRLKGLDADVHGEDFHIDIVPGRFTDNDKKDVYLHRENDDKVRLKTNPQIHVEHVRDSGVRDAIRLVKYWRERNGIEIKTFVLEIIVIEMLKDKKDRKLQTQLKHVWTEFRNHSASLSAKDPANPEGNDLAAFLSENIKTQLRQVSEKVLKQVDDEQWESIFGKVADKENSGRTAALAAAISSRPTGQTYKPFAE
ncbi:MAG: nucleotidyltransferase [Candidatus Omnitrophica bacterium]|nr:nucleotidyltransferase [Candidatus Omnitrophota bacterium]